MLKLNRHFLVIALPVAAVFTFAAATDAVAQKLSYEQAWASCKKEIGANAPGADSTRSATRISAGGACMKKYGYRLKKKI